jgi:hypothetical protein
VVAFDGHEIGLAVGPEVLAGVDGCELSKVWVHFGFDYVDEVDDLAAGGIGCVLEVAVEVGEVIFFGSVGEEGRNVLEIAFFNVDD